MVFFCGVWKPIYKFYFPQEAYILKGGFTDGIRRLFGILRREIVWEAKAIKIALVKTAYIEISP